MNNPYGRWRKGDKIIVTVILILIVVGTIGLLTYLKREGRILANSREETVIGPLCGPMPTGQLDDMIPDEGSCRNQCRSRCEANSLSYHESSLGTDPSTGCNVCNCVCS